jgi:hypothetical protein
MCGFIGGYHVALRQRVGLFHQMRLYTWYDHQADIAGMELGRNYGADNRSKDRQIARGAKPENSPLCATR